MRTSDRSTRRLLPDTKSLVATGAGNHDQFIFIHCQHFSESMVAIGSDRIEFRCLRPTLYTRIGESADFRC